MCLCVRMKVMFKTSYIKLIITTCMLCASVVSLFAQDSQKLKGTVIGTEACYDYNTGSISTTINTPANAFDGNLETFVATYSNSHTWVGLDLGTPHVITRVGWSPRNASNGPNRVVLGLFEGANQPDFMDAVPLYLISEAGTIGVLSYADVNVSRGFRYVRYLGPSSSRTNIAEIEFYGYKGEGDDSHFYQVTNLPTLSYHTYSGNEPYDKVNELDANMCLIYDDGTLIQEYPITARLRGNASTGFPKKPYRIKFNDGKTHHMLRGSKMESPAKARKWTLINNYGDKTLMRNIVSFETSRRIGMEYTVWCQPVDVIVNGEYKGCYQLCDQITADPYRVPVTEMEPTDIEEPFVSGGYLVEVDAYAGSERSKFSSKRGIPVTIKEPGEDEIVREQSTYIKNYFDSMENLIWSSNYTDPETGYRSKLDLDSFLKYLLLGEFTGNTDTYYSTYMYKERSSDLFYVGPGWDYDLAFDNDNRTYPVNNHSDWVFRTGGSSASGMVSLVNRVMSDPYADNRLKEIWAEIRDEKRITVDDMVHYVDSMEEAMAASARLNFLRWPILNQRVHQNAYALGSYDEEVEMIRNCIRGRVEWFDNKLNYGEPNPEDPVSSTYDIATADDMLVFMRAVNNRGQVEAIGRLTADIDMSSVSKSFTPIGTSARMFVGTFDGQGHKITNLRITGNNDFTGLFGYVGGGAVIKNLILDSSCSISGGSYVGLIGGSNAGGVVTMENLGNEGTVTASGRNAGGIIGCNMGSSATFVINNCYVTGNISGGNESGTLSGWLGNNAMITNTYSIATISGNDNGRYFARYGSEPTYMNCYDTYGSPGLTTCTSSQALSGELCYLLNGGQTENVSWYQTLSVDMFPVPIDTHAIVFKTEDGTYTNGTYTFNISTPAELATFARVVNGGRITVGAELTADLDMTDITIEPIGTEKYPYLGNFDGNNHTIYNLEISSNDNAVGLFGYVGGGAEIHHFTLDESCSISGASYVGLIGASQGEGTVTLYNLGNQGSVTASGNQVAGIIGSNRGTSNTLLITNCYTSGNIIGKSETAAICGWLGASAQVTNCYNSATITGYQSGRPFGRYSASNPATFTNCYDSRYLQTSITRAGSGKLASGELCYLLNGSQSEDVNFYQTLGIDHFPVLSRHAVVMNEEEEYVNKLDYEIEDEQDLIGFATMVNTGFPTANAVVTRDLDMTGLSMIPIGNSSYMYSGTFDGQGHVLSNAIITGGNYTGLFGYVAGGCTVQNMTMDSSCSITGGAYIAGFIGGSNGGGEIVMNNLGFEGRVTGSAQNAGGIIGCNMSSAATFILRNCYSTGTITGEHESAALSGWVGNNATLENCYSVATVSGIDGNNYLYRGTATLVNCYAVTGNQGFWIYTADLKSGKVCYQLNQGNATNPAYRQNLSEEGGDDHPVLLADHKIVYQDKDKSYINLDTPLYVPIESIELSDVVVREGSTHTLIIKVLPENATNKVLAWTSSDDSVVTVKDGDITCLAAGTATITAKATDESGVEATCVVTVLPSTYEIENAEELMAFASAVNSGSTDLNARLTADIDMSGVDDFVPIGSETLMFTGTFDGQSHIIDNLIIFSDEKYVGLIGGIGGGAVVKNLILGPGSAIRGYAYVGLIGCSFGSGTITMENLGNEGTVTATGGVNAGGIIGCCMGSAASFVIKNCYVTGDVTGISESAELSGWVGSDARISNCWTSCHIEGVEGNHTFYRGTAHSLENCYQVIGDQVTQISADQVSDGTLCYWLNGESSVDPVWYQKLGEDMHPVFDSSRGIVYLLENGKYDNDPNGTGLNSININNVQAIYSLDGVKHTELQRGINVVRQKDGTLKKINVK